MCCWFHDFEQTNLPLPSCWCFHTYTTILLPLYVCCIMLSCYHASSTTAGTDNKQPNTTGVRTTKKGMKEKPGERDDDRGHERRVAHEVAVRTRQQQYDWIMSITSITVCQRNSRSHKQLARHLHAVSSPAHHYE